MKPTRHLGERLAELEAAEPPDPSLLPWLSDAELDELAKRTAAGNAEGARALLAQADRRVAAGEPPWSASADGAALREAERVVYWKLVAAALQGHEAIDYPGLHREARRRAAERLAGMPPARPGGGG